MAIRSKEQLAVMLKLIKVNELAFTRRNLGVRQKIWHAICQKLNRMQGAQKDVDGWKRSYQTWRLNAGNDYNKEVQKIIKDVPDDDYFCINVTEDEFESDNDYEQVAAESPSDKQKVRLHEMLSKHVEFLNSNDDDKPLTEPIWLSISEELNSMENAQLKQTPHQWKKHVDWDRYKVHKRQKSTKRVASPTTKKYVKRFNSLNTYQQEQIKNPEFAVLDNSTCESGAANFSFDQNDILIDELIVEEPEIAVTNATDNTKQHEQTNYNFHPNLNEDIDALLNDGLNGFEEETITSDNGDDDNVDDDDYTEFEFKPQPSKKTIKPTPIVKSYKYSNRIVSAVERLSTDVSEMKDLLKKTTETLACLGNAVQQQCHKQDETNALLKRNGQMLKMLVMLQSGRSTNATKSKLK